MRIELVNTGSELLLGRVLNTHQQWICRQLADAGYEVTRQVAIADTGQAIHDATREALERADLVIVTGGLGPTADDITRDKIAELLDRPLVEDAATVERIREFFARRNRPMPESTKIQAMIPVDSEIITNHHGTAPGLVIDLTPNRFGDGATPASLIMLPGPPRELRPMFTRQILPLIKTRFPVGGGFACRTLKSAGVGESQLEEILIEPLAALVNRGLIVGFCARTGEVDVRLAATGEGAAELVMEAEQIALSVAGKTVFGREDETLEQAVVKQLASAQKTIALAESCTGGYIGHRITNVSGASAVFLASYVTYSNEAKQRMLGVKADTVDDHGAVSEAVVREMAEGARTQSGADYAIAVTGIAGPTGGTDDKPVGTVFIALASKPETKVLYRINSFDRETFKFVTAQQALDLLRITMLD